MSVTAIKPAQFPWFDYSRYSFSLGLKSGSAAYLSGHTGSEYDPASKRIVVRGGMTEQVRTAYAKIGAILETAGLGYGDVVRVVEYLRPEGIERYGEAAAVRAEVFGKHRPVVNTVPVKSLLRPEAFIEIEVTASAVSLPREGAGTVFLPTVQPIDDRGNIIGAGDVVAQTRAIFERAGRMLADLDHLHHAREHEPGHRVVQGEEQRDNIEDDPPRGREPAHDRGVDVRTLRHRVDQHEELDQEDRDEDAGGFPDHEPDIPGAAEPPGRAHLRVVEAGAL